MCSLVGLSLSFFHSKLAIFLSIFGQRQLIRTGPNVCCVLVPNSGNAVRAGSSDEPRSRPRTDAIYLAPDPDLGPDPSPGSAVCRSGFSVNLRRKIFNFKQIFIFKPDFGPEVVFLDCPLHRGHRTSLECDARIIRLNF